MSDLEAFALKRATAITGLPIGRKGLNKHLRSHDGFELRVICDGWCYIPNADPNSIVGELHVFEVEDTSKMSYEKILAYAYMADAVSDRVSLHVLNRYGDEVTLLADPGLSDMAIDNTINGGKEVVGCHPAAYDEIPLDTPAPA